MLDALLDVVGDGVVLAVEDVADVSVCAELLDALTLAIGLVVGGDVAPLELVVGGGVVETVVDVGI
jgi:hypothetical protein